MTRTPLDDETLDQLTAQGLAAIIMALDLDAIPLELRIDDHWAVGIDTPDGRMTIETIGEMRLYLHKLTR